MKGYDVWLGRTCHAFGKLTSSASGPAPFALHKKPAAHAAGKMEEIKNAELLPNLTCTRDSRNSNL
jgi:hypothetical protein